MVLGSVSQPTPQRPNILFVMADQMRADMLGSSGNKVTKTPNLDSLAARGVRFKNAFSSTPTCTPARAAILTGLSPWYHGMLGYGRIATRYNYEMPRALSEAGYFTYSIGKDHFGWNKNNDTGISHGYDGTYLYDGLEVEIDSYDEWFEQQLPGDDPMATGLTFNDYRGAAYAFPEYYHPTAWVGRAAMSFLESYNKSNPFFLKVSFHRPHSPYDPPKRWMDQFKPEDMPPAFIGGNWDSRFALHYNNPPPGIWCADVGSTQVQYSRQAYYASVGFVDEWIGNILNALAKLPLQKDTLVIFTADHGDMMSDHYHWRKGYPYFGSASVPMLLSWPPYMEQTRGFVLPRGSVLDEIAELRDIFPTVLDAAGLSPPDSFTLNGSSLLQLLTNRSGSWREYIDLEHDIVYNVTNHWNSLTDGHMKYIFRAYFGDEQLFNLDADPRELNNIASSLPAEVEKWRKRMIDQFTLERRGSEWISNGTLLKRVKSQLYSPNYPRVDTGI